jgi:hypothetical protein
MRRKIVLIIVIVLLIVVMPTTIVLGRVPPPQGQILPSSASYQKGSYRSGSLSNLAYDDNTYYKGNYEESIAIVYDDYFEIYWKTTYDSMQWGTGNNTLLEENDTECMDLYNTNTEAIVGRAFVRNYPTGGSYIQPEVFFYVNTLDAGEEVQATLFVRRYDGIMVELHTFYPIEQGNWYHFLSDRLDSEWYIRNGHHELMLQFLANTGSTLNDLSVDVDTLNNYGEIPIYWLFESTVSYTFTGTSHTDGTINIHYDKVNEGWHAGHTDTNWEIWIDDTKRGEGTLDPYGVALDKSYSAYEPTTVKVVLYFYCMDETDDWFTLDQLVFTFEPM